MLGGQYDDSQLAARLYGRERHGEFAHGVVTSLDCGSGWIQLRGITYVSHRTYGRIVPCLHSPADDGERTEIDYDCGRGVNQCGAARWGVASP